MINSLFLVAKRFFRLALGVGLLAMVIGCREEPRVVQYSVPKPDSIQLATESAEIATNGNASVQPQGEPTHRMLAAAVASGDQIWFFKMLATVSEVDDTLVKGFDELLRSVRFSEASKPQWQLPSGWTTGPASAARFATLISGNVETSVMALPAPPAGQREAYLLQNVNRWRGQLSLPPLRVLGDALAPVPLAEGGTADFLDIRGWQNVAASMRPPFAAGGPAAAGPVAELPADHPPIAAAPPSAGPASASATASHASGPTASGLQYDVPAGWQPGAAGAMRAASFVVSEEAAQVEITAIALGVGDVLSNVNRWRGQIGLEPLPTLADLQSETLTVGGAAGTYVQMHNEEKASSILAVIVPAGGRFWFLKLSGDTQLAKRQEANFRQFVTSIKFPG